MIKSLQIRNFKNLSALDINRLSRVNLISGKNNVGKTSLLEALRLFISDTQLTEILNTRGEIIPQIVRTTEDESIKGNYTALASLFTHRNTQIGGDNVITISDGNNTLSARFMHYIYQSYQDNGRQFQEMIVIENPDNHEGQEMSIGFEIVRNDNYYTRIPLTRKLKYLPYSTDNLFKIANNLVSVNYNFDNADFTSKLWNKIALTDKEQYVIEALQIIEPTIESIAFLEDPYSGQRYPVAKIKDLGGRAPLKSMGDGINHILAIVLAIVNCENGCAIIDEIDNGLHFTVQKQLWATIFKLSKTLNVQVFATTHSYDCINSFSKAVEQSEYQEDGLFIRLEMKNGRVSSTEYNYEDLKIVASQNIEIR